MKELRLCLIGFGNAGKAFCRLLGDKAAEIERDAGCSVVVSAVAGRSKGNMILAKGIDAGTLVDAVENSGGLPGAADEPDGLDVLEVIRRSNADVLLELSTLSIFDGQPAISHIEEAFKNGMHVITANKGPIAWDFRRLAKMAADRRLEFLYETVVMDGTPVFNLVRNSLPGCRILGFRGILNSTTNFIVAQMEKGFDFNDAVREAQRRGFAEADPSLDIDGWDAAAKTAALANALLGADLKPTEVDRTGIAGITAQAIEEARKEGRKYKLICEASITEGVAAASVRPVAVGSEDIYSLIDATSSIITIRTDLMGDISIVEKDPEIEQTAYGIYSDLLTLIGRIVRRP